MSCFVLSVDLVVVLSVLGASVSTVVTGRWLAGNRVVTGSVVGCSVKISSVVICGAVVGKPLDVVAEFDSELTSCVVVK